MTVNRTDLLGFIYIEVSDRSWSEITNFNAVGFSWLVLNSISTIGTIVVALNRF